MKNNRDKVENMAPRKQLVPKKTPERITSRSKKFKIDYDTVENVDIKGSELLASWRCLLQEKEKQILTSFNKLVNMQPSKLSDNRLRQEIEQHIDFQENDIHVMKQCMNNLQISIKYRLSYLRKQKMFLLDYKKKLENVYNTTEKSKRLKIPDPFPKFLLDVKREYYHMFNEKLLIPSNERSNKNKRQMIEANTVSIGSTRIYFGRTGRTNVMTPIHENELEFDKCLTGQCVDSCCTCHRSDSELSFLNHELNIECMMYETIEESKAIDNCSGKEEAQMNVLEQPALKSKIPVPVKLPPLTVNKKMKCMEKSSSTPLKLPILLPNKKMKNVEDSFSATLNPKPLLPNKNIQYVKEQSKTTLKLPPLLPDKKEISKQEKPFTNCLGTPKILQPLKMLPQNIKKTLDINVIRDEKKKKSKVMSMESMSKPVPQQTAETKASNEILDMHKASDKDCYIPERKYRYSRLHKSSVTDSYIPKIKSYKVSKIVHERYCTTRKQKSNIRKQTERELSDSYLKPDQFHTMPQNLKKTLIIIETRDEKKEEREVLSTQSMSKSEPQQTADTTASNEMYKSAPQQTAEITTSNKMSKLAPQQTAETTASNKMSKPAPQQYDETTASNEIFNLSSELTFKKRYCSTREHKRNIRTQTEREKTDSYPELDQYHTMLDIEVADKYPNEDIFHKLDDIEMIGFYQVQEKNLIPIIENMSDNKMIELYEKLYDQHIEVTQSIGNTVDDTQSSSLGSSIDDFQDAEENDGTLKTTIKTFVKKNIPDFLTNSNQRQPTETLSSNWQNLIIRSGTDINTQYIPMPPNTPKPKTSNSRRNRYHRKNDENNNPPEI